MYIDVSNNKFKGPLDENLGNKEIISYINTMILSNNPFGGIIPKSLGNLKHLQVLEMVLLSRNRLNGSIPSNVLNLEKLQVFDVSRNQLSGEIPAHNLSIPASAFSRNLGLCGAPLPPCKHLESAQWKNSCTQVKHSCFSIFRKSRLM
ncbi:Brassinosteroid LRR receptor kinase BRL2 [Bienertia sinuspersici]